MAYELVEDGPGSRGIFLVPGLANTIELQTLLYNATLLSTLGYNLEPGEIKI